MGQHFCPPILINTFYRVYLSVKLVKNDDNNKKIVLAFNFTQKNLVINEHSIPILVLIVHSR